MAITSAHGDLNNNVTIEHGLCWVSSMGDCALDNVDFAQHYRCKSADGRFEINQCLRHSLKHPGVSKVVPLNKADAPAMPETSVLVEVVERHERFTEVEWFRLVKRHGSGIGLLLNADIDLDEGQEHLGGTFDSPETFLALTRTNQSHGGFHLGNDPHWTQGVRADAKPPESLHYASSFQGCINRIAYDSSSVNLQASKARHCDNTSDSLCSDVNFGRPSLAQAEISQLEFTLWTRSEQRPAGVLVNLQAIKLVHGQLRRRHILSRHQINSVRATQ